MKKDKRRSLKHSYTLGVRNCSYSGACEGRLFYR